MTAPSAWPGERSSPAAIGMVFVPVTWQDAIALQDGAELGVRNACAATPTLAAALGTPTSMEEAEFAALSNAGVLALLVSPSNRRLVLAAEVEAGQVTDPGSVHGEVTVSALSWPQVQALFADEPEAYDAVKVARRASMDGKGEPTLAAALEIAEVDHLLNGYDLLWFAPTELDHLAENQELTESRRNRAD